MKILIATAVYYPQINGVAVFSHNLATGLASRGHEVVVICPSQTGKSYTKMSGGVRVNFLKSIDVRVYPDQIHSVPEKKQVLGIKWPRLFYRHGFRASVFPNGEVRKILENFQPDVVHVQVSDPIGLSVVKWARKLGIPIVTTEHNQPDVITEPLKMPRVFKRGINSMLSVYFRDRQAKSDFVTMPTERAVFDLLGERDIKVPIAAVSNGVDLTNFKPGRAKKEIYEKYKIPIDRLTVLYVGRVDPEKRVGLVVEAFLRANTPKAQLVIVGDGVDRIKLMTRYADYDNIIFTGKILPPDLYEIYKVGDVFVTASEIETQGIVLIEAAATGLPLIAVDKGAVAEICIEGKNGRLCKPGSVAEISHAIKNILTNTKLRQKYSQESLDIASEHDFERTLDKFINIYNKVIQDKT